MSANSLLNCLKASTVAVFLLIFHTGGAQGRKNDKEYGLQQLEGLNAWLTQNSKAMGNDVVALVAYDTLVFRKEMGELTAKTEAPLAAASQWLTAALILQLAEEGKLRLDDKVADYLPIFATYGKNYITLRHCLSHFTGIQTDGRQLWDMKKAESLEEAAASFAKREIQTNPGTEFRYSIAGPIIAGRIAELVMKKKFDQLIKQKLFNPLGMSKTTFGTLDNSAPNPAGGARSTANDYLRFLQMLLNGGRLNGKQILSEASVKEMRRLQAGNDQIRPATKLTNGFNFGLGAWAMEEQNGLASAMVCPGFYGAFPIVDWCHRYAAVVLTKNVLDEPKTQLYLPIKIAIDERRDGVCK